MNKKIRNLFVALSGLFLSVGAAVGVGLNEREKTSNKAEALTYSRIYYVGTETGWGEPDENDTTYKFHYVGNVNGNHYYQITLDISKGSTFKIRDWEEGHESDWMNSFDSSKVYQSLYQGGADKYNLICTLTGRYTITYRWTSSSNRCIEGFEVEGNDVYFVNDNSWGSDIRLHAWKSDQSSLTDWNDACIVRKVSSIKIGTSDYDFYHAKVPTAANGGIIFKDASNQTGDLSNIDGNCYQAGSTAGVSNAGKVVGKIYTSMGSFTNDNSQTFDNSICAIDSTTRSAITTLHSGLVGDSLTVFNNSHLNTYDPENLSNNTDVSFKDIFDQLTLNTTNNLPRIVSLQQQEDSKNVIMPIMIASVISVVAVGGYFFIKRKHN